MDVDVAATLVISSAVGGATGSFVKELAGKGVEWLIQIVAAHSPAVQEKSRKNMENFLYRLGERVERLEHEIPVEKRSVISEAMDHPNTAFLIGNAMKFSAITDNEEHHALLAELIAQRLGSGGDDMVTLAGTAACGIVNSLSVRQINFLATLAVLLDIRPLKKIEIAQVSDPAQYICNYWGNHLSPLLDRFDFKNLTGLDLEHLVAMGCLRIGSFGTSLPHVMSRGFFNSDFVLCESLMKDFSLHQQLQSKWELIGSSNLTSTGKLIGILHHDCVVNSKTTIDW
jgi:hypothetical protein